MMSVFAITTIRGTDPDVLDLRTVGFFETAQKATEVLDKNHGDLNEAGYYSLAIIEEVEFGLYPKTSLVASYQHVRLQVKDPGKWEKHKYAPPLVEKFLEKQTGFALIG